MNGFCLHTRTLVSPLAQRHIECIASESNLFVFSCCTAHRIAEFSRNEYTVAFRIHLFAGSRSSSFNVNIAFHTQSNQIPLLLRSRLPYALILSSFPLFSPSRGSRLIETAAASAQFILDFEANSFAIGTQRFFAEKCFFHLFSLIHSGHWVPKILNANVISIR